MKISACWIAKNEAENIGLSIESVKKCADEMIVIDTGSTDDTVAIAKALGARVEYFEWINDFAAARNYALSFCTEDVIITMDCDEYFDPHLQTNDHAIIEQLFHDNPYSDGFLVKLTQMDKKAQAIIDVQTSLRLFRNSNHLRYFGKIHESLQNERSPINGTPTFNWNVYHTGYTATNVNEKLQRNISLLESAHLQETDPQRKLQLACYLMREYYNSKNADQSFKCLQEILKNPVLLKTIAISYGTNFIYTLHIALLVAHDWREQVNRNEIYHGIVEVAISAYPDIPSSSVFPLLYQAFFDLKEDIFLQSFASLIKELELEENFKTSSFKHAMSALYGHAARAELRRGNRDAALAYLIHSFQNVGHDTLRFSYLLKCLKGYPIEENLLLLNKLFDFSNPETLVFLTDNTAIDGFTNIHAYFIKKQMDAGIATKAQYLLLLLLFKKNDASVQAAFSMYDKDNPESENMVRKHLLLTAICSDDQKIYAKNAEILAPHAQLLNAYFDSEKLVHIGNNEEKLFTELYPYISLIVGIEAAENFYFIHANSPACASAKVLYCDAGFLYEQVLSIDWRLIDKGNLACYCALLRSYLALERYDECLSLIKDYLNDGILEEEFLHILLVIAEKSTFPIAEEASALYNAQRCLWDAKHVGKKLGQI